MKYIATRTYQQALGRLQRLVIQRLFELHKMNVAQTGTLPDGTRSFDTDVRTAYRMRTQIAKNLQKRCKAIRTAVRQYNTAAAALNPPRPALDWSKVSHFSFVEEFTLLQDTRNDIRAHKWAQPLVRETMRTARRIKRAEEELEHVHREARRVHTSICDEDALFTKVLQDLSQQNALITPCVVDYVRRRRAINAHILAYLRRLYSLDDYKGLPGPGKHAGAARESLAAAACHSCPESPLDSNADMGSVSAASSGNLELLTSRVAVAVAQDDGDESDVADEDEDGAVTDLVDHMANIAVVM